MTDAVLGIDLGTTEARAGIFDLAGAPLGIASAGYPTDRDEMGRAEQDPDDWWTAVGSAVREALADASRSGPGPRIAAVCGVGQGPTLAVLDDAAASVRPAITWQDRRAGDGGFGLLPRIAWLAANDPAAIERARWLTTSWDALGLWLSGTAATTIQSHEAPIDSATVAGAGADPGRIPAPIDVGAALGGLRPEVASRLGLPTGTPVVAGVNDGTASMLGAGLLEAGDAVDTGGASGGLGIYTDRPLELRGTFCAPAPIEGRWVVGGAMASTGAALDWLAGPVLGGLPVATLLAEAESVAPGSDGLVFLPYLAGERAPIFDDAARGAFVGLTLAHGRGHLARAVLEAAAFALRHVAEPIVAAGVDIREMRLAGRPARSELWARIKADVTGFPVGILAVDETALLGAAILAARGARLVPGLDAGVRAMTRVERRIEPDPADRATYDAGYRTYRAIYPALRSMGGGR